MLGACMMSALVFAVRPVGASDILFEADFASLANGGHTAASFLTATGLTFTRASGSTVQTSASALTPTTGTDYACVGSLDGTSKGLVIQQNVKSYVGTSTGASPRNLTIEWAAGSSTVNTYPYADSPDGSGTGCTRCNVSSGGYAPYGDPHGGTTANRWCFSSWQRSKDSATNGNMQQGILAATPGDGTQTTRAATNTWGRVVTPKGTASLRYYDTIDARDYSASGGDTAQARDILVDYVNLEAGDWASEAIPTGLSRRANDRLKHTDGASLVDGGRLRFYAKFYPKFSSSQDVYYDGSGASGTAAHWYLWSYGSGSYARIDATTKKLEVKIGASAELVSANQFTWTRGEAVEIYIEVGANVASVAMWKHASGDWFDLSLGTETTSLAPSGDFYLFANDAGSTNGDSGQLPCWLDSVIFYSSTGSHTTTPAYSAPTLTSVSLDVGDTAGGGQLVTLTGTNFYDVLGVTFGGTSATEVTRVSSTSITCRVPAHASGAVSVVVTTPAGSNGANTLFEYWTPAQITSIDAYLDSNKGVTASAGAVGTWTDQSANARSFTQATGANKPTQVSSVFGSLPAIRFTATKWVRLAATEVQASGRSVFFVGKWTSSDATETDTNNVPLTIVGDSTGAVYCAAGCSGQSIAYQQYIAGNNKYTRGTSLNDGTTRLLGWTHSTPGDEAKAYSGTSQIGATTTGATYNTSFNGYDSIGASQADVDGFDGDLGAVIVVAAVISAGDMTKLHKWAQQRFGAAA